MRRAALLGLFLLAALAGYVAGALTPQLLAQPTLSASQSEPAYADTSKSYTIGYEVTLKAGGQNVTVASSNVSLGQGPRVGAVSVAYGLGYALGAENYTTADANVSEPASVIIPPPETVTETETVTQTVTVTTTVVNGTTIVRTVPQAPTELSNSGPDWRGIALVGGLVLLLLGFLAMGGKR